MFKSNESQPDDHNLAQASPTGGFGLKNQGVNAAYLSKSLIARPRNLNILEAEAKPDFGMRSRSHFLWGIVLFVWTVFVIGLLSQAPIRRGDPVMFTVIILAIGAFCVFMMVANFMRWQTEGSLRRAGILVPGEVVRSRRVRTRNAHYVAVRYRFKGENGQMVEGTEDVFGKALMAGQLVNMSPFWFGKGDPLPAEGAPVVIVWDGQKRHRML
jgi:hypothetical protein